MNNDNYLPLDIKSARSYGITKWQKEFFWPVSYKSYTQMETDIKNFLNEFIKENNGNELSELLIINYKLFLEYSSFLYSLRVLKEVDKNSFTPLCSDMSVNFKGILENGVPLKRRLSIPSIQVNNFTKKLKSKVRFIKANMRTGKLLSVFQGKTHNGTQFVANRSSLNSLCSEYICNSLNGNIVWREPMDWYSKTHDIGILPDQKDGIYQFTEDLIKGVERIATAYNLEITELQRKYLHEITHELLLSTMMCLNALKKYVSSQRPLHLLVGSGGTLFNRMLSVAVRDNGESVTGFKHGEPVIHSWDYYSWMELSTVDRFITYTKHSARMLESVLDVYPTLRASPVKIEGMETNIFYDLWRRESKKPIPEKIERVMIVAKGLENDNRIGQCLAFPELMQLDWELRIISILKGAGYKVLYKVHPRGVLKDQVKDLFDNDIKIVFEPLEEVFDLTDAFLFYHTLSTTSGQALCTNKPIIYINGGWEPWVPQVYELFARRCRIVSAHFDERNRLIVNEVELLNALARKPDEPDTEFIEKYMLPEGVKV